MTVARPLRDVFTELIGTGGGPDDPAQVLRDSGHPDLPDGLVAEAVVNFAETAPVEVAEHLSTYVAAHSPVPQPDAGEADEPDWLSALTSAPLPVADPGADLDASDLAVDHNPAVDHDLAVDHSDVADRTGITDPAGLDFGHGHGHDLGTTADDSIVEPELAADHDISSPPQDSEPGLPTYLDLDGDQTHGSDTHGDGDGTDGDDSDRDDAGGDGFDFS